MDSVANAGLLPTIFASLAILAWLGIGGVIARITRIRGLLGTALAPSLLLAIAGIGAIVAGAADIAWSGWALLGCGLLVILGAYAARRLTPSHTSLWAQAAGKIAAPPHRIWLAAMVGLATLPYAYGMGKGAYIQRWDSLFHASALQKIATTGDASSLTLGSLAYADGTAAFYPGGWHALAAVLPGPVLTQLTAATMALIGVAWVLGMGGLTQVFTDSAAVFRIATLGSAVVVASPLSLAIGWGHMPNAAGFAALPGVLALGLRLVQQLPHLGPRPLRRLIWEHGYQLGVLTVAGIGLALCHPNAALGAFILIAAGFAVWAVGTYATTTPVRWAGGALSIAAVWALLYAVAQSPVGGGVADYSGHTQIGLATGAGQLLIGLYELWANAATAVFTIAAPLGVYFWARAKNYLPAALLATTWAIYLDAAAGSPAQLASLWYSSPARTSVLVTMVALPLSAYGAWQIWQRWLAPHMVKLPGANSLPGGFRGAVAPLALVAIVGLVGHSWGYRVEHTGRITAADSSYPRFLNGQEWELVGQLPELTNGGTILGNPFSGAASAHGLTGVPVVFPVANQVASEPVQELLDAAHAGDLLLACDALTELSVEYLYTDADTYQEDSRYRPLDFAVPEGAHIIATGAGATLYRLPPCGGQN